MVNRPHIGLVVNPFAGLGGPAGLKGTDGAGTVAEALARGSVPKSGLRARAALVRLAASAPGTAVMVAPGPLGADSVRGLNLDALPLDLPRPVGTGEDTRRAVAAMSDCDLVLFAGGDGTARDVASALTPGQAMLGIPSGVKMQSGVFALTPQAAGNLLADIVIAPERVRWREDAEIMDIDEAALRHGIVSPCLHAFAKVPVARGLMQAAKGGGRPGGDGVLDAAARELASQAPAGVLHLVGPGTGAGLFARALGIEPTLLGVDAILDGRLVARDADAATLNRIAEDLPLRVVLGVTGAQGFLIGRGNQQIGPDLLRRAGRDGFLVLAAEEKLLALDPQRLWVDSGDAELDADLAGFLRVHTGAGRTLLMRIGPS